MDKDIILDMMQKKADELFNANCKNGGEYAARGRRGAFTVQIKSDKVPGQWDAALRHFGASFWEPEKYHNLIKDCGCNFEAGMMGKVAYARRSGKNSGVHWYETLGGETFWPGALISADGNCICAFGGLSAEDDVAISHAGIAEYERQCKV